MIKTLKREIYEIEAKVVDASGAYNNLSGNVGGTTVTYPVKVDSHQNNDDCEKALLKAYKAFSDAESLGYQAAQSGRPLTTIMMIRINDGKIMKKNAIGAIPDIQVEVPDPEPEEPETPEEPENSEEPEQNGGE